MSCFILKQGLVAQVVPPPATQTEVNAGANRFKYVTPYTFANSTIAAATAAGKQNGTFLLTNFSAMGITNIVSANANTVITTNSGVLTLTSSGGGTPAGSTTQIQYNNAGAFGGSSLFTYEEASLTGTATVRGTSVGAPSLRVAFDNGTIKRTNAMIETGLQLYDNQNDPAISLAVGYFGTGFSTVSFYTNRFYPTRTNHYDAGTFLLPFRTNYANDFVAKNSVTAQSFIGSGTGTPILKLQTMMSADNAFAITVATNRTATTTNIFDFTSVAVNDRLKAHSSSAGQIVWTNAPDIEMPVTGLASNVVAMKFNIWTNYVNTVSNFVFTFNTNRYELKNQTNVIFTNIVEEATAVGADMAIHIHNTTGVTMGLVWPAYGAQHGYFFQTNINNPILTSTTLTTGKHGVASFTAYGTNIFATWSEWP